MTEPKKFRKKPVVIEAIQLTDNAFDGDHPNPEHVIGVLYDSKHRAAFIDTLEGTMRANIGDWIIRGVNNELYPCKPEIFAATYEEVNMTEKTNCEHDWRFFNDQMEECRKCHDIRRYPVTEREVESRCDKETLVYLRGRCQRGKGHVGLCSLDIGPTDQARAEGRAEALAEVVALMESRYQELGDTNEIVQPGSWAAFEGVRDLKERIQAIATVREMGEK